MARISLRHALAEAEQALQTRMAEYNAALQDTREAARATLTSPWALGGATLLGFLIGVGVPGSDNKTTARRRPPWSVYWRWARRMWPWLAVLGGIIRAR